MTILEKKHTNKSFHITMEIDKKNENLFYVVEVCPLINENLCGYPIKKMIYSLSEKKKANNTFNRYVKKYT